MQGSWPVSMPCLIAVSGEFMGGMNAEGCAELQTLKSGTLCTGLSVTSAVLRHFSAYAARIMIGGQEHEPEANI